VEWVDVGGASAVRFRADGSIRSAYRILGGTLLNCAGGKHGRSWLSCEEHPNGYVWECDPWGARPAVARPALGRFSHEAVASSYRTHALYLTEDRSDGRFYRFTPAVWGNLAAGRLDVMEVADGHVHWHPVPDPDPDIAAGATETRHQVPESTAFAGGEGICISNGVIYFTTKGDGKVWEYRPVRERICVAYDPALDPARTITGVDNITGSVANDLYVCEDNGADPHMEIVMITPTGTVAPFVRIADQQGSELTGVAFNPAGNRMYFSSQRGGPSGITYEVRGPFRATA
jgi:secreted PhoX family phosphatase